MFVFMPHLFGDVMCHLLLIASSSLLHCSNRHVTYWTNISVSIKIMLEHNIAVEGEL